jgi:hypothetical protein
LEKIDYEPEAVKLVAEIEAAVGPGAMTILAVLGKLTSSHDNNALSFSPTASLRVSRLTSSFLVNTCIWLFPS